MQPNLFKSNAFSTVVVNDEPTQLKILAGLLRKAGCTVAAYAGVETAFTEMNPACPPDLIVTDLYMPGIDGWRFCRLLRSPEYKAFNCVPILVVSATFSGDNATRIAADVGAQAFLPSPVDSGRFLTTVRALRKGKTPEVPRLRVLVVDDSQTLAKLLANRFDAHGYRVDVVHNAHDASKCFAQAEYDIAVLDYHLPDRSGDTLLREFARIRPDCVCMMITTDPNPELALAWMKAGAAAYLRKPFDPEYLIEQCLRARRERALLRVEDLLEKRTRQLRRSQEKFQEFFDQLPIGLYQTTLDGDIVTANPACLKICGCPESERDKWLSQNTRQFYLYPEDGRRLRQLLLKNDRVEGFEAPIKRWDGSIAWLSNTARLIRDEQQGRPKAIAGSFIDISDRKHMERQALQTEKTASLARMAGAIAHLFNNQLAVVIGNLELLQDDMALGFGDCDSLRDAMQAAQKAAVTSRNMLTILGKAPVNPEKLDIARFCREYLSTRHTQHPHTVKIVDHLPDSGPCIQADRVQLGQIVSALVDNALEALNGTGQAKIAVCTLTRADIPRANCFPVEWRPTQDHYACLAVTDTGHGMDAATIDRIFDPFYTDKFAGRGLGLPVALGIVKAAQGCMAVVSKPGRGSAFKVLWPLPANVARHPATDRAGAAKTSDDDDKGALLLLKNPQPSEAALQQITQQARKMESIGRLAGGVAHDMNNLLSPILGYAELLCEDLGPDDIKQKWLHEIIRAGKRARDLIRQLLAFSRKQTLELKRMDVNVIIQNFSRLLHRTIREDIEIKYTLASTPLPVMADVNQIEQVIMNLAVNAADAMPTGGMLFIETAKIELDAAYAASHPAVKPGEYALLAVSDTGCGMNDEVRENIFQPFFSTKGEHGTGLGLATVYGIVKQHDGNIWVYSEIDNGAAFKIYLPLTTQGHAQSPIADKPTANPKGSETILLVEDNDQVRLLAHAILVRQGYTVLVASNGNAALQALQRHSSPLHLLVTDVIMPGMNGKALFQKLAKAYPGLKVLYMSGYSDDVIAHRGILEQGAHLLQKPFTVKNLAARVRMALDAA